MTEQSEKAVRWEKGADGIVVVTLDDPGRSANTMNERYTVGDARGRRRARRGQGRTSPA